MPALSTEDVLREEAKAIHGDDLAGITGQQLYRRLNELDSAALCLSGGGIRSASFALGVIQALAVHPRPGPNQRVASAQASLLAKFDYLSTVSGGGYIGSWLSAWIARAGFDTVWDHLTNRPQGPDVEPPALGWLRSYSNYLTPKLGLTSADTWAAIAIVLRNLILNWLVIVPVFCLLLLVLKTYALLVAWFSQFSALSCDSALRITAWAGVAALILALFFTHTQRPSHCDSRAGLGAVLLWSLFPAVLSGIFFSLALATSCAQIELNDFMNKDWFAFTDLTTLAWRGLLWGVGLYVLAWIAALPCWRMWRPAWREVLACRVSEAFAALPDRRAWCDLFRDFIGVVAAGAVYGILLSLGAYLYFTYLWSSGAWKFTQSEIFLVVLTVPWAIGSQLIAEMIFVGLTSLEKLSDSDREWLGRAAGNYILAALLWAIIMFLIFLASTIAADLFERLWAWLSGIGAGGVAAWLAKSSLTPAKGSSKSIAGLSANVIAALAAAFFVVILVVMLSALLDQAMFGRTLVESAAFKAKAASDAVPAWPGGWQLAKGFAIAFGVAAVASFFININRFSLHALYRNRLIRAFLGASHVQARRKNPFTDFDNTDNLHMHELWPPREVWDQTRASGWQPFHMVNMALNIVSTKRLAWQERKAESFTVSPLHSGSACGRLVRAPNGSVCAMGAYRPSRDYGDPEGISVGTAIAISGAAASPNMGYHSSPALAFLMTLFNVRLGWWLGNPKCDSPRIYRSDAPRWAVAPLISEMTGNTDDESNYVYLSDGGHFENLGLYEMVRRRCRFIVVSDAGCDPGFSFEDLGNAIRKIEIDLGVRITMSQLETLSRRGANFGVGPNRPYWAIGQIDYASADGAGEPGFLLYIKPSYHGAEKNTGVRAYALANADFPHQTTGDQFFSESQFESYRALGFEITDEVLHQAFTGPARPPVQWTLQDVGQSLQTTVGQIAAAPPASQVHQVRAEVMEPRS